VNQRIAVTVLLAAVTAMAASPIAMRVDVEPVRAAGDKTTMAVTVQVAPEDRSRVGTDAWIQGELRQRGARVERLARAVDLDENGRARIEIDWPPGEYELQIEIEGEKRRGIGVWIRRVTVPDMRGTAMDRTPASTPVSETAATVVTTTAATVESEPREPDSAPTPTPDPTTPTIAAAAAITATAATPSEPRILSSEPEISPEPKPAPLPTPGPTTESIPVAAAAATAAAAAAASEPQSPGSETRTAQPSTMPAPEAAAQPAPTPSTEALPVAAATTAAAAAPSEPRSPSPDSRDPTASIPAQTAAPQNWPVVPGSTDLTVMVTERNRPVIGLEATAFGLKIAGKDTVIERIGEGTSVPLNLGLAVAMSHASNEVLDHVVHRLEKLALRTTSGNGEILLATTGVDGPKVVPWGAGAEDASAAFASASTPNQVNLSAMVSDATRSFAGRRGRSFLIVITDGSDTSTKADWKDAASVATAAGIPIFVVGLSDTGFPSRTRSSLVRLATASGGRSYFLADAGMLELTLDYVGELIDSSYVLQFTGQADGGAVKVDAGNRAWEVHHPSRIP